MYVLPMSITEFHVPIAFNFPVHTTIALPVSVAVVIVLGQRKKYLFLLTYS